MRELISVAVTLVVLFGGSAVARAKCGDHANDAAAVAATEAAISAQCSCCAPKGTYATCVASILKTTVHAKQLAGSCVAKVHHDVGHACPLASTTTPCQLCNADSDCGAGAFCECRSGSCTKTGGVCTTRPQACPEFAAPVCGCDGTTYANDCMRLAAGACKLHDGPCVASGGCFDTIDQQCTGVSCSPAAGCPLPNEFCSPTCGTPPPTGTCFDTMTRKCSTEACAPDRPCLPNQFCVTTCPPPPPSGHCFVTVERQCSQEPCGPGVPCQNPNEICDPQCPPPSTCTTYADCNDGNGCTVDHCVNGTCEHTCVCLSATGAPACCPGPAALCAIPCGMSAAGTCGGICPTASEVCTDTGGTCTCTPTAPTCGGSFPTCNGACPVGSTCESLTGAPICQCVPSCISGTGTFFYTCGDPVCGGHRPHDGVPACTTERAGDPCACVGATCDPGDACNRLLECAISDPTHGGICPL